MRGFIVIQSAIDAFRLTLEKIHDGPKEVGKIGFEASVEKEARQSLEERLERRKRGVREGQGTRSWLIVQRAMAMQGEFVDKVPRRLLKFMLWSECGEGQGGDFIVHGGSLSL